MCPEALPTSVMKDGHFTLVVPDCTQQQAKLRGQLARWSWAENFSINCVAPTHAPPYPCETSPLLTVNMECQQQ